jgi:hypothetical protein
MDMQSGEIELHRGAVMGPLTDSFVLAARATLFRCVGPLGSLGVRKIALPDG